MQTQKIFQAGNSNVVAIPNHILKEAGLKRGEEVTIQVAPESDAVIIKKAKFVKKHVKTKSEKEFQKWLKEALKEDAEILDELALR